MSLRHPKVLEWERRLKSVFDRIDDALEDKYGSNYRLSPTRRQRGTTSNKEHDGLFNVGSSFSAGYGSEEGPGYIVNIHMSTREAVPTSIRAQIQDEVAGMLRSELTTEFPDQELEVSKDGRVYKIHGDLSLD